jgi:hypothetical protein
VVYIIRWLVREMEVDSVPGAQIPGMKMVAGKW